MQLFFTDETNLQPSPDAKFFVYGGLIIPLERLVELDREVERLRSDCGYKPGDELKFETRARPAHVSVAQATEAKRRLVAACLALDCKFIVHIILHEIVRHQNAEDRVQGAANYVLGRFNYYLNGIGDYGICIVDSLPVRAQFKYLSDKFSFGLDIKGQRRVRLDRIKLFAASCVNASHAHSAIDVVLGCFRYCINNPKSTEVARELMLQVTKMTWHHYDAATDTYHVGGRGLITRPPVKDIKVAEYRAEYETLFAHINDLLKEADAKPPTT